MKKSILLALLLIAGICHSQAPKKTNTIIVSKVSRSQVVNILLDNGYYIDKIDTSLGTVRTEPKKYATRGRGMIVIDIRIKDSAAIITGHCGLTDDDFVKKEGSLFYSTVENAGMKGSLGKESFAAMDIFASLLGGKKEYFVR